MSEKKRKTKIGTVVSDKMDKTVVVRVETLRRHPLYKKVIRRYRKFKVHDENNACHLGDLVKIGECRPISKEKSWNVIEILGRQEEVAITIEEREAERAARLAEQKKLEEQKAAELAAQSVEVSTEPSAESSESEEVEAKAEQEPEQVQQREPKLELEPEQEPPPDLEEGKEA